LRRDLLIFQNELDGFQIERLDSEFASRSIEQRLFLVVENLVHEREDGADDDQVAFDRVLARIPKLLQDGKDCLELFTIECKLNFIKGENHCKDIRMNYL
jgi:hypothetical protein